MVEGWGGVDWRSSYWKMSRYKGPWDRFEGFKLQTCLDLNWFEFVSGMLGCVKVQWGQFRHPLKWIETTDLYSELNWDWTRENAQMRNCQNHGLLYGMGGSYRQFRSGFIATSIIYVAKWHEMTTPDMRNKQSCWTSASLTCWASFLSAKIIS